MTWPVGDYQGRRRSVAVVEREGLVELQFTGTRGGITPCAVHPSEAFRVLAAICGRTATIHDISGRAVIVGAVIRRDASGDLDVTQLHRARPCDDAPRRDAPVTFDLPPMQTASDAAKAAGAAIEAVADGDLTPQEGAHIMALVETYRRTLETTELEARVAALEGGADLYSSSTSPRCISSRTFVNTSVIVFYRREYGWSRRRCGMAGKFRSSENSSPSGDDRGPGETVNKIEFVIVYEVADGNRCERALDDYTPVPGDNQDMVDSPRATRHQIDGRT